MKCINAWTVLLVVVLIVGILAIIAAVRGDRAMLETIGAGVVSVGPGLAFAVFILLLMGML